MSDKELIEICINEISQKLGYTDPKSLRQRDLEHICREIEKSTNILISLSTIKRLLNGQFNRLPQIATLNAITTYLGYQDWQDFKIKKQGEIRVSSEPQVSIVKPPAVKAKHWFSYKIVILVIAVLSLAMISINYFSKEEPLKEGDVSFSVKKVTSNDIPNTVVFSYDLSKVKGDSFFIQQSWDQDRRVKVDPAGNTLTDIYYEPGYHNAKLMVNDKIVKTIDVHIPTNGWYFYSKPHMFQGLPTHIRAPQAVHDGVLGLTAEDIIASKVDPHLDNYYNYTLFFDKMSVSTDNFRFTARVRWKELRNTPCPKIMYEVFGQSNSLFFFTTPPGCTGEISARAGEHFLNGKSNDLSAFGGDIREWQDIEVVVKNKEAKVYINKKEVFTKAYTESYGMITGIALITNGICEIDAIDLAGLNGQVVYSNGFDK